MNTYEAMYLLDDARCNDDYDGVVAQVKDVLERHRAELVSCEKWDQRKLCYAIKRRQRATYVLIHFKAPADAIAPIRAASQLLPTVLRVLILVDQDTETDVAPTGAPEATASDAPDAREPGVEADPEPAEGVAEAQDNKEPEPAE